MNGQPTEPYWFSELSVFVPGLTPREGHRLAQHLQRTIHGVRCRSGLAGVLVEAFSPQPTLRDDVILACTTFFVDPEDPGPPGLEHLIPTRYDGEDLLAVADALKMSSTALIEAHTTEIWSVAAIGFAPGFGYLVPTVAPNLWTAVNRHPDPRPAVPAGSVAVAAGMSAIYPRRLPGGWQIIGTSDVVLFDTHMSLRGDSPCLLQPGDTIRFVQEGTHQ